MMIDYVPEYIVKCNVELMRFPCDAKDIALQLSSTTRILCTVGIFRDPTFICYNTLSVIRLLKKGELFVLFQ